MPIATIRPNAVGDVNENDVFPAGTANWDCVDEAVSDGDTTYVTTGGTEAALHDLYNIPDGQIPAGSIINSVKICINSRTLLADVGAFWTYIKTYATVYIGLLNTGPVTYAVRSTTYLKNPNTLAAWTIAEIDALQIGVRQASAADELGKIRTVRTTQVWIEVDYTVPVVVPKIVGDGLTWIVS